MSQAPNRTRSRVRRLISGLLTAALAVPLVAMNSTTAAAATDENPSFYLNANDLDFILRQIQISEAHAYAEITNDTNYRLLCRQPTDRSGKCVPDAKLPFGVRTVDGTHNNIVPGRERWGSADNPFPRQLAPFYRQADAPLQAPGAPAPGDTTMCETGLTCYAQWQPGHVVYDAQPREISNLIVDQSIDNPAAVNAATHLPGAEIRADGTIFLPNMAPDEGLSAQTNAFFTFFGQFFDHGLDLVDKGGNGTLVVPLAEDDPIREIQGFNEDMPYLMLTRATRSPGPDGTVGTADDVHNNETTPFVDQNQTYTSHPSHQVFLREYAPDANGVPRDTGRLLNGAEGGLATWDDVKNQARNVLGINLTDSRVLDVPQVVTDPYGNFVPGPNGFPRLIVDNNGTPDFVEGNPAAPVAAFPALTTGHSFLDDIAHGATPGSPPLDAEGNIIVGENGEPTLTGYDNVALGAHFITGDGRGNENIALSAVHAVFHAEHNRMIDSIRETLEETPGLEELEKAYRGVAHQWKGSMGKARSHEILPGPEADNWSYEQRLFQAARFATEMQYQHLVFEEFARTIQPSIDAVVFNENSYNPNIDPAITAEFAHVVYRFGHSMLTEEIERAGFGTSAVPLLDGFLNPAAFNNNGALNPEEAAGSIINGTVRQPSSQIDEFVIDTLRNNLLGLPLDLPTINMLRARDAGVPPLQQARSTFFQATGDPTLRPYASWTDFGNNLKNGNIFGRDETNASLVNFVAAYGTHESILAESTIEGRRNAAAILVNGAPAGEAGEGFTSRIFGENHLETAALISASQFPDAGVDVVYITTGSDFPDALAAGALAAAGPGPILLTDPGFLPAVTAAEVDRLDPQRIVILGGPLAVSLSVEQDLATLVDEGTPIDRVGGANAYETAVMISQLLQPTDGQADRVYVTTGLNFPDALVVSAAAARDGDPVLLSGLTLPDETLGELERLAPNEVVILGGPLAVPEGVEDAIGLALPGADVIRLGGESAYDTAALITGQRYATGQGGTLYIATGTNFPDSLAVGPVAGLNGAPLLIVPPTGEIPEAIANEITRLAPDQIVILGGPLAVDPSVETALSAFGAGGGPNDRVDFMLSTGEWATNGTGLEDVDFWVGGLAERVNPFGGMLGSTFNFVFEEQLEALQFGDRFYYLFRNQGNQLFAALEANSFSSLIERNTDASNLPANIFFVQDPVIDLAALPAALPGSLRQDPDGTWRWIGDEHIEIHGTAGNDRIRGDEGDDSISAKDGNDFIEGGAGNDTLVGGAGNDVITDSFGDDVLKGGWGNDALSAGPGFDILHGGPGHDFLMTGGDIDNSFGGDGNDVFLGSTGRMIAVTAGEGNDWVEGGRHADLLQGDNADQFQADVIGGNDIVLGRGGDDDIEGEGGDDILVGEWFGTDRHLGNMGFDWITYYGETADVNVDFLLSVLQRPDVTAVRDRYDQLEAMSGSYGDDTLSGIGREFDGTEGADPELHKMTEETLYLVDGLREFLQPPGHDNYAARFMAAGEVVDTDGVNNIILGGPGSDTLQGRGGNDVLDGDLMLRVQLARVAPGTETIVERQDSAAAYQERVFRGEIDPGDFRLVRELVDDSDEGDLDTAVYIGARAEYTITDLGDGYYEVWHSDVITGGSEAEESEGADVIRNVELLQFFDGCWDLRIENPEPDGEPGAPCETIGVGALDTDSPVENQEITASLFETDGTTPFDLSTATDILVEWLAGEGSLDDEDPNDDNPPVLVITEVEVLEDGNLNGWTITVPFGTAEQWLRARISLTIDGTRHVILTPWTANPVTATQVASVIPDLVTPGGLVVGQNVQAFPPTDGNGVETAAEAGWIYRFQSAANAAFTVGVQELRADRGNSWTLQASDAGRYIRVIVEFVDDSGFDEMATTNVVGPVIAP